MRNITAVGAYCVPNYLRQDKRDSVETQEVLTDANKAQITNQIGTFRVQPGAYVPATEHRKNDGTTTTIIIGMKKKVILQ